MGTRYAPLGVQPAPVVPVATVQRRPTSEITVVQAPPVGVAAPVSEVTIVQPAPTITRTELSTIPRTAQVPGREEITVTQASTGPPSRRTRRVTVIEPGEEDDRPGTSRDSCPGGVPSARITTPRRGIPLTSVTEAVSRLSLEEELMKHGYVPLERIMVGDGCSTTSRYIRARNKVGQVVFILVDTEGYIGVRPQDLTMVESKNANVIPYSIKKGAYDCAQVEVSGVAFDCQNSVCIVTREENNLPRETNFVYAGRRVDATAVVGDDIISYPVIRLSEIRANPDMVLAGTMAVTSRIQRAAWAASEREMCELEESLETYLATFRLFKQFRSALHERWSCSMNELVEPTNQFLSLPEICKPEDRERFRLLQYNLSRRNTLLTELLRCTRQITEHRCVLERNKQEIFDLTNCTFQEYKGVDSVIPLPPE